MLGISSPKIWAPDLYLASFNFKVEDTELLTGAAEEEEEEEEEQ